MIALESLRITYASAGPPQLLLDRSYVLDYFQG